MMSAASTDVGAYVLRYQPLDFLSGAILFLVSVLLAVFAFVPFGPHVQFVQVGLAFGSALCAWGCFVYWRTGRRYRRGNAWYLSFDSAEIRLHFFDFDRDGDTSGSEAAILGVASDQLIWIRQAVRINLDGGDNVYVDMRVSPQVWEAAKQLRAEFQDHLNPLESHARAGYVEFFQEDILRIKLDGSSCPEDLVPYWQRCKYPVVDTYEIGQRSDITVTDRTSEKIR